MGRGALYGHQLPIIVFRDPIQSFRAQATLLAREILSHINPANISSSFIGIGNVYTPLEQVRQSYQESLIATSDTAIPVKFRFYTDLPSIVPGIDTKANKQYEQQFFDYIRAGNWQEIHQCFTDFIDRSKQLGENLLQTSQKTRELLWIASRILGGEMGVEHHTQFYYFKSTDYRQLSAEVLNYLKAMENSFQDHQSEFEADTIHYIKQFIIDHAHEEISLDRIGKEVGLSPIYISKCFKDQLGMNYIHFLTECRINKAQKLMRDPNKTLKEITFDVGYHDPNYFSKVFKKICKTSPTEYRNKLLHKV
ncbi:helix-turn-helix domain-containing protein [Gracilibacillus boraciitolerans]|uniref:helix-turn-helix domain-containing protein n=1 Tax=Gracilibacillus boraciitolerans TaxID=307521 RepID=UPI0034E1D9F4